ncbi:MAG: alpha/beta fold hydrolase [Sphingobacteriales bacterium]
MQKQIEYKEAKIFYKVIGSGEPVVFIHGFSEDSDVWKYQIDFLKNNFQLIVPDMPGSGFSKVDNWQLTVGNEYLTVEWMADCVRDILDNESITNCCIIGHSMGGYTALAFAEKYPQLLNKFGLFHSTAYTDSEEKIQNRRRGIQFIKEHGAYAFLKQSIPNLFASKFSKNHPEEITALIERGKSFTAEALIQYYEAMIHRPDRTAVLKNFSKPILFIIGTDDKAVSLADSLQQCHLPSVSHVTILDNVGHMGMWEEKDKCNRAIQGFLQA